MKRFARSGCGRKVVQSCMGVGKLNFLRSPIEVFACFYHVSLLLVHQNPLHTNFLCDSSLKASKACVNFYVRGIRSNKQTRVVSESMTESDCARRPKQRHRDCASWIIQLSYMCIVQAREIFFFETHGLLRLRWSLFSIEFFSQIGDLACKIKKKKERKNMKMRKRIFSQSQAGSVT